MVQFDVTNIARRRNCKHVEATLSADDASGVEQQARQELQGGDQWAQPLLLRFGQPVENLRFKVLLRQCDSP